MKPILRKSNMICEFVCCLFLPALSLCAYDIPSISGIRRISDCSLDDNDQLTRISDIAYCPTYSGGRPACSRT